MTREKLSVGSTWNRISNLGEQLISLESAEAQKELIVRSCKDLIDGQVQLWFFEPELPAKPKKEIRKGIRSLGLSALARSAVERMEVAYGPDVDSPPSHSRVSKGRPLQTTPSEQTGQATAVPMLFQDTILGVIQIYRPDGPAFSPQEKEWMNGVAFTSAMAVSAARKIISDRRQIEQLTIDSSEESVRHSQDAQRRVDQMASITEVSNAITSILNLDDLLQEVVQLIHKRLGYPNVQIFDVHPGRRKIFYMAGECGEQSFAYPPDFAYDLDDPMGLIPWAARNGKSLLVEDVSQEPLYRPSAYSTLDTKSELVVPLIFGGTVLGILDVQSDCLNAFDNDDLHLLETLGQSTSIAIRNAYLYRSEKWRRQVADSMREVAGLLTAETDLDNVLDHILQVLANTLPCDVGAIWLLDRDQQEESVPTLRLAAVNINPDLRSSESALEGVLSSEEVLHFLNQSPLPNPWLMEVLDEFEPVIRQPTSPYEPLGAILDFPTNYSAIAAPLHVGEEPLGVILLSHQTAGRYGHESQSMTHTFASYAAVAIENARLYEAAHDQAWVSTVLLQVTEATQSLNSLEDLLATMVRITPRLIGVNSCSIYLWDSSADVFQPAATHGLEGQRESELLALRISLGDIPAFDNLFFAKEPVFIDSGNAKGFFSSFDLQTQSLALFPMLAHGQVVGAFLVDYSLTLEATTLDRSSSDVGWSEKFTIIQGIAHQTAVAVENIQLLKAQKEEAYVSIALLQVAQTVVSLNALEDILETIVRITPILVGVKRSIIFLWDASQEAFTLAQSFGVNRSELSTLGRSFAPQAFPLLEVILKNNRIVFHAMTEETDSPLSWKGITLPQLEFANVEEVTGLAGAVEQDESPHEFGEFLKSRSSLLFGFPLSVKGTVLGVMLTQEMDFTDDIPSVRVREKRLEITLGITQQAALAIQNEQLQREVVERERLEREFQLAREIQETFLPDSFPEIEGWELDVLWHPARLVSGDFYDLFELPGEHLGIVIADVADKGMPAALFMTLIRTLIRASVVGDDSPASVLCQVNDLLVPDAKHGTFVTVVYAILSLSTGKLTYANAGHNRPLLWRNEKHELVELQSTGMALGVFEGIKVHEVSEILDPHDVLVLYTDGVTEAFSEEDELFGEERLRKTILGVVNHSARSVIEAIDRAVSEHASGVPSSDDITLVAIRRLE